ncbi:hypothetical protein PsorP6_016064 [Peronosclerospora sorghi]|uniref:Uncharacterized protein n=1 Tax=Peronosclerospora sorghi TaxID=230839 RepID=A0ACC0WQE8_9STRA|nr:hypothetical protein PsorP6_016064 [Peronosclerospora sorghi]
MPPSSCAHRQRNPKSYWAWFQRKWIIDRGIDERNFHCWNYRRHVCNPAGIEQNFSNYSALHHRSITLPDPLTVDVLLDVIALVQQAVFTEPDDPKWLVIYMLTLLQCSAPDAATFLTSQLQLLTELLEIYTEAKWVVVPLADVHDRMGAMTEKKQIIARYERAITLDHDHCRYYEDRIKKQSN